MPLVTPATFTGFISPFALEADLDNSTLGQAGPIAGTPEVTADAGGRAPALTIEADGEQTSTDTLHIETRNAGNLGDAGYTWHRTRSGAEDAYDRGLDMPAFFARMEPTFWSSLNAARNYPHSLVLPDDTLVLTYAHRTNVGDPWSIQVRTMPASTGTYSSAVTVTTVDNSHAVWPCLVRVPDDIPNLGGVLLLFVWNPDDTNNVANVDAYVSRDGGASWGVHSTYVLNGTGTSISDSFTINSGSPYYTLGRLRAAFLGHHLVLLVSAQASSDSPREFTYLYTSRDVGARFDLIGALTNAGWADIVSVGASAWIAYVYTGGASGSLNEGDCRLLEIQNAWAVPSDDNAIDFITAFPVATVLSAPVRITSAEFCITAEGPYLFVAAILRNADARPGVVYRFDTRYSDTSGRSILNETTRAWLTDNNTTATEYPTNITASMFRRQLWIHGRVTSSASTYNAINIVRFDLGGYSSVTMPSTSRNKRSSVRAAWSRCYWPFALPLAFGWTVVTSGTASESIATTAGALRLVTGAGTQYYTVNPTATSGQAHLWWFRVRVISGGGVSSREIACSIRRADAGLGYEAELRFSTTQIRLRDINGAADLATVTVATTAGVDVLLAVNEGKCSAWYRSVGTGFDDDRYYLPIATNQTITDDAGAGGTADTIMFGNRASGTATSEWHAACGTGGTPLGLGDLAPGLTNPDDLRHAVYLPSPTPAYLASGVRISAHSGPAMTGDQYTIRPSAKYALKNALPVGDPSSTENVRGGRLPSSREVASETRSTATNGYWWWKFRGGANRYMPPILGIQLEGLNAPLPALVAYNADSGATTTLGTVDNVHAGLRFLRASASSPTIVVDTSGTSTDEFWCDDDELVGDYLDFGSGDVRLITGNLGGWFSNDANAPSPVITVEGIDGTEPTSGTCTLIRSRATVVVMLAANTEFARFGLYWSATTSTYEGYLRVRVFAPGPLPSMAYVRDWGEVLEHEDPAEVVESRSGLRKGRKAKVAARRVLSLPLTALLDQAPLLDPTNRTRRWYKAYTDASYGIAGVLGDEIGKVLGTWLRAGGSQHPVAWVPRFARDTSFQTLVGRNVAGIYGRIITPPKFKRAQGRDTGAVMGLVVQGDTLTLAEET